MTEKLSKKQIADSLASFIWSFKIGDNIIYNLKILFVLDKNRELESNVNIKELYNKPIFVLMVSIIEAIFYDLVRRLDVSTAHFPAHISQANRIEIKKRIKSDKVAYPKKSSTKRIKNYRMDQFVSFFKEYELLGPADLALYDHLSKASKIRNRIHIPNYHQNFESDESDVFTSHRLNSIKIIFQEVLEVMARLYRRPFNSDQSQWLEQLDSV